MEEGGLDWGLGLLESAELLEPENPARHSITVNGNDDQVLQSRAIGSPSQGSAQARPSSRSQEGRRYPR